jgi:hypothetical protein
MKAFFGLLLCAALSFSHAPAQAQARSYDQAELDALLAPIALYPDPLLSQILMAATYPGEVAEAARWSRANPHLKGEQAVSAVAGEPWDASVKSLVAFPEILARMDESPQWMLDLGEAFLAQEPQVMATVQALRQRAQASGHLASNEHQNVYQYGRAITIYPVQPNVVYVPYYDPYVVYGPWWWPAYRPVYWRPWGPAPVFVTSGFFFANFDWHRHYVRVVHRPAYVHVKHVHVVPGRWRHRDPHRQAVSVTPFVRVPESRRQPIVRALPPAQRVETPRREQQRSFREVQRSNQWQRRSEQRRERPDTRRAQVQNNIQQANSAQREHRSEPRQVPIQAQHANPIVQGPRQHVERRDNGGEQRRQARADRPSQRQFGQARQQHR